MITSSDNFLARLRDGVLVVTLTRPDLIDADCIRRIGDEINTNVKQADSPRVVVDFDNVRFLSSSALGMLVALRTALRHRNGNLCICNVTKEVQGVFRITRLRELIPIHLSTEEAVRSLAK